VLCRKEFRRKKTALRIFFRAAARRSIAATRLDEFPGPKRMVSGAMQRHPSLRIIVGEFFGANIRQISLAEGVAAQRKGYAYGGGGGGCIYNKTRPGGSRKRHALATMPPTEQCRRKPDGP